MLGPYQVQLDLSRIARRISDDGKNSISDGELECWLRERGFVREMSYWRVEWHRSLLSLVPEEILDIKSISGKSLFKPGVSLIPSARTLQEEFERIESRNAEIAKAATPKEIEDCRIPSILIGRSPKVASSWRTITRRAARAGSWGRVLENMPFVPIDHAPGNLLFGGFAGPHDWPNVALHAVHDHFATDTRREDLAEWCALERTLLLDGIERFWFCLASLKGNWTMILDQAPAELRPGMAQQILRAFVRWWPQFIRLSPRFLTTGDFPFGWPHWGWTSMHMCVHLGVDDERIKAAADRGPLAAVDLMSSCLDSTK